MQAAPTCRYEPCGSHRTVLRHVYTPKENADQQCTHAVRIYLSTQHAMDVNNSEQNRKLPRSAVPESHNIGRECWNPKLEKQIILARV